MVTSSDSNTNANAQLVSRIQAGDHSAETELVEKFSRAIGFELRKQARNGTDVEDLFQETFRIALEKIRDGQLRQPGKLGSFLLGIARFTALDFYRREGKHHPNHKSLNKDQQLAPGNPLLDLLTREQSHKVRLLIPELKSSRDREILFRFFLAEEDKDTICEELGISRDHFSRVIHRAKKRFKELLLKHHSFKKYLA